MTKKAQRSAARRRVRRSAVAMAPATAIGGLALVAGATTADAQPTLHASPGGGNASGCPSNNPCSLDNAIGQATLGSTIDLAQGTYAGPVTTLTESLSLVGAAEDTTIIKGGDPVIRVDSGAVVSISLLTIEGGSDDSTGESAGGIDNAGTLTLNHVLVMNNTQTGDPDGATGAGAIYNDGILNIENSTITRNTATGRDGTPGIVNDIDGKLTIQETTVSQNDNTYKDCFADENCSAGGGLQNDGIAYIYQSIFNLNTAYKGGAIANAGDAYVSGVTMQYNSAFKGGGLYNFQPEVIGGGIQNAPAEVVTGTVVIVAGFIANNNAFKGGGIYNDVGGLLTMRGAGGVDYNNATTGGGIYNAWACDYEELGVEQGSGIQQPDGCSSNGVINLTGTTLQGNNATEEGPGGPVGGGIDNEGTATLTNTLIDGNVAADIGGGVANDSEDPVFATLTVTNNSIHGNTPDNCYFPQAGCPA